MSDLSKFKILMWSYTIVGFYLAFNGNFIFGTIFVSLAIGYTYLIEKLRNKLYNQT